MAIGNQDNPSPQRDQADQRQSSQSGSSPGGSSTTGQQSGQSDTGAQRTTQGTTAQPTRGSSRPTTRSDRQREVPMSREGGRGDTAVARPQGSSFPSLFSPPGALAGAFIANPFEFMHRISEEMDTWFENFGLGRGLQARGGSRRAELSRGTPTVVAWMPQVETFRRGNELVVRADVPGVQKENLDVRLEDGALIVSGERQQEREEESQEGSYRSERSYGSFYRAIPLPEGVSEDKIAATYRDGVLEVTVPMPEQQEQQRGRKIEIR